MNTNPLGLSVITPEEWDKIPEETCPEHGPYKLECMGCLEAQDANRAFLEMQQEINKERNVCQ